MKWLVELFFVVAMVGSVVAFFATAPQGPVSESSNREAMEQLYTNVGVLVIDPQFLRALEEAICDGARTWVVRNMVETALGAPYVYNVTVYPSGLLPPCLACAPRDGPLLTIARPSGYSGPYTWHVEYRVVLPSGAQVVVALGIGRP
ncbi:MAG: hypothetical protein QXE80_06810 [Pyrobaculum sp.]